MESVGIVRSKDVDMDDDDDSLDLEYEELALGRSKRRRKGSGSYRFNFTSACSKIESEAATQCPSVCSCDSDDTRTDRLKSTSSLRSECLLPAAKVWDSQASTDKSHGRAHFSYHRYGPEVQVGPAHGERNSTIGFPTANDRDMYKTCICKNDLYEFRISKYHRTTTSISFLDRLRATQAASPCTYPNVQK